MFSNYNNLNTSYTPGTYNQKYPTTCNCTNNLQSISPNKPFEIVDMNNQVTGYFWYQGNTLDLVWDITGEALTANPDIYINAASYVQDCELICKIYNFRKEVIVKASSKQTDISTLYPLYLDIQKSSVDGINDSISCILHIDQALSNKLVKGIYSISLTFVLPSCFDETILDGTNCKFEVR